jgi:outer membrane receptor protein involved in Fe transport
MRAFQLLAAVLLPLAGAASAAAPLDAQGTGTVAGIVSDAATGQPLGGARIQTEDGRVVGGTTAEGLYRVRLPAGRHVLGVRALGYTRATLEVVVSAGGVTRGDVRLSVSPLLLDEVVAVGSMAPMEVREVPNAVSVVTAEDIRQRGAVRIDDVLRTEFPGLFLQQGGAAPSGYDVRLFARGASNVGSQASPPKIYLDGVLLTDVNTLASLDPESIERIEFIPGPQASTLYGSDALNGVMLIRLKKGTGMAEGTRVRASTSLGTVENNFDTRVVPQHRHTVDVEGATGATSFRFGGAYMGTGEWLSGRTERRVSADGGIRLVVGSLVAEVSGRLGRSGADGYGNPYEAALIRSGRLQMVPAFMAPDDRSFRTEQQNLALTLSYEPRHGWRHRLTTGIDSRHRRFDSPPRFAIFADSLYRVSENTGRTTTLLYSTTVELPGERRFRPSLTAGVEHTEFTNHAGQGVGTRPDGTLSQTSFSRTDDRTTGYFAQGQVGVLERVFFTAGLRVEDNPNYGETVGLGWSPRVGATFVQDAGALTVKVRGAYGEATRPPPPEARITEFATDPFLGITYPERLGNPDIRPEVQRGGELGVDLVWGGRGSLQVTRYQQVAHDLIAWIDRVQVDTSIIVSGEPFEYPQLEYVNVARVRNRGWEVQGRASAGPWSLRGTWSTADSRVLEGVEDREYEEGDIVFGPARQSGSLGVRYEAGRLAVGGHLTHVGAVRIQNNDALGRLRQNERLLRLAGRTWTSDQRLSGSFMADAYQTVDLSAEFAATRGTRVFGQVQNAFDQYRTDAGTLRVTPGRRSLAGVRVTF